MYKQYQSGGKYQLTGIQLKFNNGAKSEMFASAEARQRDTNESEIEIDTSKTIRYVKMHILQDASYEGIELLDENRQPIVSKIWSDYP